MTLNRFCSAQHRPASTGTSVTTLLGRGRPAGRPAPPRTRCRTLVGAEDQVPAGVADDPGHAQHALPAQGAPGALRGGGPRLPVGRLAHVPGVLGAGDAQQFLDIGTPSRGHGHARRPGAVAPHAEVVDASSRRATRMCRLRARAAQAVAPGTSTARRCRPARRTTRTRFVLPRHLRVPPRARTTTAERTASADASERFTELRTGPGTRRTIRRLALRAPKIDMSTRARSPRGC